MTLSGPYIDDVAPPKQKAFWFAMLSLFPSLGVAVGVPECKAIKLLGITGHIPGCSMCCILLDLHFAATALFCVNKLCYWCIVESALSCHALRSRLTHGVGGRVHVRECSGCHWLARVLLGGGSIWGSGCAALPAGARA